MRALFFDCDGVLADTERDGHRVAFNEAFAARGLAITWTIDRYRDLLKTAGGKERIYRYFDETKWPVPREYRDNLVLALHKLKTERFMTIVQNGRLPLRSGVARLMDEAIRSEVKLAVCSTSNERAVRAIIDQLGPKLSKCISLFAGDVVKAKKPDPSIYQLAARSLDVAPNECVVVEDSNNGLRAALAAGMACIVTTSSYTIGEEFAGASRVVDELGDPPGVRISLADCLGSVNKREK